MWPPFGKFLQTDLCCSIGSCIAQRFFPRFLWGCAWLRAYGPAFAVHPNPDKNWTQKASLQCDKCFYPISSLENYGCEIKERFGDSRQISDTERSVAVGEEGARRLRWIWHFQWVFWSSSSSSKESSMSGTGRKEQRTAVHLLPVVHLLLVLCPSCVDHSPDTFYNRRQKGLQAALHQYNGSILYRHPIRTIRPHIADDSSERERPLARFLQGWLLCPPLLLCHRVGSAFTTHLLQ